MKLVNLYYFLYEEFFPFESSNEDQYNFQRR